ncbi:MAG: tRNA pseudouridine(55) synthase TruB [Myxococcota bacterium]|jgi:tRNA pseudouridine55 synthase|nr:tRNA pseudouridine(55) synthase TruB [Myxococcota bacterium]
MLRPCSGTNWGFWLLDKPATWSSFDVVRAMRKAANDGRIGHAGTLDPMATGVMTVFLGQATRLVPYLCAEDKIYEIELEFGRATETDDREGPTVAEAPTSHLTEAMLLQALQTFVGPQLQRPPKVSAIWQDGKRAYALARAGKDFELEPRPVEIYAIEAVKVELPRLSCVVRASKGTYMRSLARDLGEAVGSAAHLTALCRTRVGSFTLQDAVVLDEARRDPWGAMRPAFEALPELPVIELSVPELRDVMFARTAFLAKRHAPGRYRLSPDSEQRLIGLLDITEEGKTRLKLFEKDEALMGR